MNSVYSSSALGQTSAHKLVEQCVQNTVSRIPSLRNRVIYNETQEQGLPTDHAEVISQVLDEALTTFLNQQELPTSFESTTNVCIHIPNNSEEDEAVYFLVFLDNHTARLDPDFLESGLKYTKSLLSKCAGKIDLIYSSGNHLSIHLKLKSHNVVTLPSS